MGTPISGHRKSSIGNLGEFQTTTTLFKYGRPWRRLKELIKTWEKLNSGVLEWIKEYLLAFISKHHNRELLSRMITTQAFAEFFTSSSSSTADWSKTNSRTWKFGVGWQDWIKRKLRVEPKWVSPSVP